MNPEKVARPYKILYTTAIFSMAVVLWFAVGANGKSLILVAACVLSPLLLLLPRCRVTVPRVDIPLTLFAILLTLSAMVWNAPSFRAGTWLMSMGLCFFYAMTVRLMLAAHMDGEPILRTLRAVVLSYGAVLLLQQLCVLIGVSVFNNISHYANPWKLNALSNEPSHTSVILGIVMFYYALEYRRTTQRGIIACIGEHPWVWVAYVWCLLTPANVTALIALPVSLIPWITRRNVWWAAGLVVGITAALGVMTSTQEQNPVRRLKAFIGASATADTDEITRADISGASRALPVISCARDLNPSEPEFWTGHGTDADIRLASTDDFEAGPAYLFHILYNYGIFVEAALMWLVIQVCFVRCKPATWVMTAAAIFLMACNNQAYIWIILTLGAQYKWRSIGEPLKIPRLLGPSKHNGGKHPGTTRVAVIGTQGVPAHYGGFESLVENIIGFHKSPDIQYTIFCSSTLMDSSLPRYKGAELRYVHLNAHGIHSVAYDIISLCRVLAGYDTILILGVSGCVSLPVLKHLTRSCIIVNIDGHEYRRNKWGPLARSFLRLSETMAVHHADVVVTDNKGIQQYVNRVYHRDAELIAYGGDHAVRPIPAAQSRMVLDSYGLTAGGYSLAICRIEPENNVHIILEAFRGTNHRLAAVGNWGHSEYSQELWNKYKDDDNLLLLDSIYDLDTLYALRSNARYYIHGHSAGGTNPSLVEAMFFNMPILAYDVVYNRETTFGLAHYFTDSASLRKLIDTDIKPDGRLVRKAHEAYNWKTIAAQYEHLFRSGRSR